MKWSNFVESIVSSELNNDNSGASRKIITQGVDLDYGVVKLTQNFVPEWLRKDNLVDNGHMFQLNVKQLYRPIEGQEKFQIRKPYRLRIPNLEALMRYNSYAHVVDYLVLTDPK